MNIFLGISVVGFAATALVLALRRSGILKERDDARRDAGTLEGALALEKQNRADDIAGRDEIIEARDEAIRGIYAALQKQAESGGDDGGALAAVVTADIRSLLSRPKAAHDPDD